MSEPATLPRPEHPRPQFVRERWVSLNGPWEFEFDPADSGLERGLLHRELNSTILVPFCPESELSGIGDVDFHPAVWYRRRVRVPDDFSGARAVLHFGAVDHDATVWADGVEVGRHRGGFSGFSVDLGDAAVAGSEVTVVVRARDRRDGVQARGKQSRRYENHDCDYTRTTGIWQTVWLEAVPPASMGRPRTTPDVDASSFWFEVPVHRAPAGARLEIAVSDDAGGVVTGTTGCGAGTAARVALTLPSDRVRPWSPDDPFLYSVRFTLRDVTGAVLDEAAGYAGLRSVSIRGTDVLINGEPVFQRLVLDQGYYRRGVLTAPTDADLVADIELAVSAGFNGARLHQKVFEERYLYHADRLGYLVWGEFADWGCLTREEPGEDGQQPTSSYLTQWLEVLERDHSHPSIVGWCPLNETRQFIGDEISVLDDVTRGLYLATKAFDTTRPVLDASGWSHRVPDADVYDSHNYEQDPALFAKAMGVLDPATSTAYVNLEGDGGQPARGRPWSVPYAGQPYFCSEFGGIWWSPGGEDESWGYGDNPVSVEEFHTRFAGLVDVLLDNPHMFGYCYTQLTDVFQERNGLFTFDREPKFDLARLRAVQGRPAAVERRG